MHFGDDKYLNHLRDIVVEHKGLNKQERNNAKKVFFMLQIKHKSRLLCCHYSIYTLPSPPPFFSWVYTPVSVSGIQFSA